MTDVFRGGNYSLKFAFDTERYNKEIRNSFRWAIKRQGGKKGFVAMKIVKGLKRSTL